MAENKWFSLGHLDFFWSHGPPTCNKLVTLGPSCRYRLHQDAISPRVTQPGWDQVSEVPELGS